MDKWYYIAIGCFLVAMAGTMAYENYAKKECRVEALKVGKSADDIDKICK
jgi:hypothetical protein